jgi:hypothetical protein
MRNFAPSTDHLTDFPLVELRRYSIRDGERARFSEDFQTFFPEAFEQLSVMVFGTFLERQRPNVFTWLRGFRSNYDRGAANAAFYYGPVWREHRSQMNDRIQDSDNVLQLTPVSADRSVPVFPAVAPLVGGEAPRGVVVAQITPVRSDGMDAFLRAAEETFAKFRSAGLVELALLRSLDAPNPFPQLPVRGDGPFVVWLGIAEASSRLDTETLPVLKDGGANPRTTDLLSGEPELLLLDPTRRSRLRWLADLPALARGSGPEAENAAPAAPR